MKKNAKETYDIKVHSVSEKSLKIIIKEFLIAKVDARRKKWD